MRRTGEQSAAAPTVSGTARRIFQLLDRLSDDEQRKVVNAVVALYPPRERVDGTA